MLEIYGFINRVHLMRKFGTSGAQAALDFIKFTDRNPNAMRYDTRQKAYVATIAPKRLTQKLAKEAP